MVTALSYYSNSATNQSH